MELIKICDIEVLSSSIEGSGHDACQELLEKFGKILEEKGYTYSRSYHNVFTVFKEADNEENKTSL